MVDQLLRLRRHLLQLRVMLHLLTMEEAVALEQQELLEMVEMTILLLPLVDLLLRAHQMALETQANHLQG